jgi:phage shock protein C
VLKRRDRAVTSGAPTLRGGTGTRHSHVTPPRRDGCGARMAPGGGEHVEAKGRMMRSTEDRVIAGVCGGLAEHFGWPATKLRVVYVALSVLSAAFPGMLVYLALWYLMPEKPRGVRQFRVSPPDR